MISLEQAAALARTYVAEDPLNSAVDLIHIEGRVAVQDGHAYFGYQNRPYLETGDLSHMTVGIGPVRVDLNTGECKMLGSLQARELNLFDTDGMVLPGPGGWQFVPSGLLDAWRAVFEAEPDASDLSGPCPGCDARDLHRWYRADQAVDEIIDEVIDGVHIVGDGWRIEWCAACHIYQDDESLIPGSWCSPYDVPDSHVMDVVFARPAEAARQAELAADGGRRAPDGPELPSRAPGDGTPEGSRPQ
ncbi:hypothetical protein JNUCC64_18700 [Streptomyces sp. JNUCC 64]